MAQPKITVENVLPKLKEWSETGHRVCLATLYHSHGTSPRPVGSQMAICEDGRWFGYLSGGCAERAIAEEGIAAIKKGENRSARYGIGSPYLDIQLPCGAGIDVWFDQAIEVPQIDAVLGHLAQRALSALSNNTHCTHTGSICIASSKDRLPEFAFRRWYPPRRRLYLIGSGPAVVALSSLASEADYNVFVLTPDQQTFDEVRECTNQVYRLVDHSQVEALETDVWTSLVIMFHEHERETQILQTFLNRKLAYIGALGSTVTHKIRLEQLRGIGLSDEQCARVHGPVGLNINAKTPVEIGISILAELTLKYRQQSKPLLEWGGGDILV